MLAAVAAGGAIGGAEDGSACGVCSQGSDALRPTHPGAVFGAAAEMGCKDAVLIGWGGPRAVVTVGLRRDRPVKPAAAAPSLMGAAEAWQARSGWPATGAGLRVVVPEPALRLKAEGALCLTRFLLVLGRPWTFAADACRDASPRPAYGLVAGGGFFLTRGGHTAVTQKLLS